MSTIPQSSTIAELSELPLSGELLEYYRGRLQSSEDEMRALHARIDACAATQAAQHKRSRKQDADVAATDDEIIISAFSGRVRLLDDDARNRRQLAVAQLFPSAVEPKQRVVCCLTTRAARLRLVGQRAHNILGQRHARRDARARRVRERRRPRRG